MTYYAVGHNIKIPVPDIQKKEDLFRSSLFSVPGTGLEPALLSKYAPETYASTNSAIRAGYIDSGGCPGQDLNLHDLIVTTPSK